VLPLFAFPPRWGVAARRDDPQKENSMFTLSWILADGVTLKLGDQVWSFGLNFIVYLIVAAIVGFVAESLVGWHLPLGIVGAIVAALVGAWLLTKVLVITGISDLYVYGVPLLRALLGAILLVGVWHLLTYRAWHGRRRSSYSRG
jgi:uncharacterized membrane protein YeaQ/YmgE (transglycosylase-associated protein family)